MAQDKQQLVDEENMQTMSVAPPDPSPDASGPAHASVSDRQAAASDGEQNPGAEQPGVADEDPLSAHTT